MTTFTDFNALRATGYVPKARYIEQTTGQHKIFVWIHKTLVRKDMT